MFFAKTRSSVISYRIIGDRVKGLEEVNSFGPLSSALHLVSFLQSSNSSIANHFLPLPFLSLPVPLLCLI